MASTLTLPDPSTNTNKQVGIASQFGTITVERYGTEEINGVASDYSVAAGERVILVTDGTDWFILAT